MPNQQNDWQQLFEAITDQVAVIGLDHKIIAANHAVEHMTGLTADELVGKYCYEALHCSHDKPEDCPHFAMLHSSLPQPVEMAMEVHGSHYLVSISPIFDEKGKLLKTVHIARDVTSLKKEKFRNEEILRTAMDGFFLISRSGEFVDANVAASEITGYSRTELLGMNVVDIDVKYSSLELSKLMDEIVSKGATRSETLVQRKDGMIIDAELSVNFMADDAGQFIVFMKDITKRKNAERALKESEGKLNAIFNATQDGILVADAETKMFLTGNKRICEMLGYSLDEIITLGVGDIHPPKELSYVVSQFERQARKEIEVVLDLPVIRKDGSVFFADISSSPVEIDGKEFLVGGFRDATRRREVEERTRQAQKLEAIGTLASGIAHDFNNILSAILGYSELALLDISPDSTVNMEIKEVIKAGNRAKELVRQILTFSRRDRGEFSAQKIQIIAKEVLKLLRSTIPASIEIKQDIDDRCGTVLADPTQMHQLLMNLCTNSFHAMEQSGGVLQVILQEVTVAKQQKTIHSTLVPGLYVRLQVIDNGPGIEKEILAKIFDPYFSTKGEEKGTGLGLAVVLGIVESHEGRIQVESRPGEGTVFAVFFPVKEVEPEFVEKDVESYPKGQGHILFVDDEEVVADLGKKLLGTMGYTVVTKVSSVDALTAFRADPDAYDLVITDQTMPKMSGMELAQKMFEIRPDIPVILSSGYSSAGLKEDTRALGIRAFLLKPVSAEMFARTIRQVLGKE